MTECSAMCVIFKIRSTQTNKIIGIKFPGVILIYLKKLTRKLKQQLATLTF